jgi:hypothetical protein
VAAKRQKREPTSRLPTDPSPKEIARRRDAINRRWTAVERRRRWNIAHGLQPEDEIVLTVMVVALRDLWGEADG